MRIDLLVILIGSLILYGCNAARGIYPGDAGDLVTAAVTHGVPHPPGYPLYTLIGALLNSIPVMTPAWRLAWVSIVPHVMTLLLVYLFVYRLTKARMPSFVAASVLAGNYLFFLYSTTPEVFALLDVFVVGILVLGMRLQKEWDARVFWISCAVIGLSLAHHPLIVLMLPSFVYLVRPGFARFHKSARFIMVSIVSFVSGLVPYLYVVAAARGTSPINWDRPTTLPRFIQLVTRTDYGSFMSGTTVGHSIYERLLNVKAYATFVLIDYTWIGVLLACIGLYWVWKKNRHIAVALSVALALFGPFFSFYASFPIVNRFILGTVERFALPSYILLSPLVGIGAYAFSKFLASRFAFTAHNESKHRQLVGLLLCVFLLYPVATTAMTVWRFWGLAADQTTDVYAVNLLGSAPKHALMLLTRDTPLFSAQYMRYAMGIRPDVLVIHMSRLPFADYHETLRIGSPDLIFPSEKIPDSAYTSEFIKANRDHRTIVSNGTVPVGDEWEWIPNGLVFVLTKKTDAPTLDTVISENTALWASFQDPTKGLLSRYNHLFLTNVLDEYAISSIEYGKYLILAKRFDDAKKQLERAKAYGSDSQTVVAWMYLGLAESLGKNCEKALVAYDHAKQPEYPPNAALTYYEALTYRDCVGDQKRANELFSQYDASTRQAEQPLDIPR